MGRLIRMARFVTGMLFLVGVVLAGPVTVGAQAPDEAVEKPQENRDQVIRQLLERVEALERELQTLKEGQAKPTPGGAITTPPPVTTISPAPAQPQVPSPPPAAASPAPPEPLAPSPAVTGPPTEPGQPEAPSLPAAATPSEAAPPAEEEREVPRVPLASVARGGSLLTQDQFQIETRLSYSHSEISRLVVTGFSVLPLIILGTLESERIKQNILQPVFTLRYGILKDLQGDLSVPLVYQTQSRIRLSNQQASLVSEEADQFGLGDIEAALTYQPLYEKGWVPDLVVSLRARAPTGRSQFDIYQDIANQGSFTDVENFVQRLNAEGLPIGTGFWGLSGSISVTKAFDPVILFATAGYTYNFSRNVTTIQITSVPAEGGIRLFPQAIQQDVKPGDTVFFNFGFAIALTNQVSVNFNFSDRISFKTQANGNQIADSSVNVGQFSSGFTLAITPRVSLDVSGIIGLSPDAPSFIVTAGVATTFNSIKDLWPFKN